MIPELDLARVRKWIDQRNADMPSQARDQIRYEIDVTDRTITVLECRPPWRKDFGTEWTRFPICRFRYTRARKEWSLYWRDRKPEVPRVRPRRADTAPRRDGSTRTIR